MHEQGPTRPNEGENRARNPEQDRSSAEQFPNDRRDRLLRAVGRTAIDGKVRDEQRREALTRELGDRAVREQVQLEPDRDQ